MSDKRIVNFPKHAKAAVSQEINDKIDDAVKKEMGHEDLNRSDIIRDALDFYFDAKKCDGKALNEKIIVWLDRLEKQVEEIMEESKAVIAENKELNNENAVIQKKFNQGQNNLNNNFEMLSEIADLLDVKPTIACIKGAVTDLVKGSGVIDQIEFMPCLC